MPLYRQPRCPHGESWWCILGACSPSVQPNHRTSSEAARLNSYVNRGILDSSPLVMPPETTPSESALALLLEGYAAPALRSVGAARPELVHRGLELIHHTRSHDELLVHRDWTGMAVVPGHLRQRDRDALAVNVAPGVRGSVVAVAVARYSTLPTIARERDASLGPRRPARRHSRGRARAFVAPSAGKFAIRP